MKQETTNPTTTTEVATVPEMKLPVKESVIQALDKATEAGILAQGAASQFKKMFMLGSCVAELKALLTPQVMAPIMQLQNSPLGFLTDKKNGGYEMDVVRNALIEAAINGVSVCGNEFNIIANRFYMTKAGLKHKLRDIPGLYKNVTPGIPRMAGDGGALVSMHIEWTYNGKSQVKDIPFAVRVNQGMGADGIIGKATRKAYAWLYEEVTGNSVSEGDVTDDAPITTTATVLSPIEATAETVKTEAPAKDPAPNVQAPSQETAKAAPAQAASAPAQPAAYEDGQLPM